MGRDSFAVVERRRLPRGSSALPAETVEALQRERLFGAICESVAEDGYAATSVASVIARAGVSRATFYAHFPNREECFLAAYDEIVEALLEEIVRATFAAGPDWFERMTAGQNAYLRFLAERPAHARSFMVEVLAAGPAAAERRQIVHRRFAELLKAIYAQARAQHMGMPTLGDHVFVALVGAINELVVDALARGPVDPDALLPLVLDVELSLLGLDARGGG